MTPRRIPEDIKRQVRKKCFFGCVVCGSPIFTYNHLENFAKVKEHTVENLWLLCSDHHQHKTSRRLTQEYLRAYASTPFNANRSHTTARKVSYCSGTQALITLGSSKFIVDFDQNGIGNVVYLEDEVVLFFTKEDFSSYCRSPFEIQAGL